MIYKELKQAPFSVLMAVYEQDSPDHFLEAMQSILDQTVLPDEIVLVMDGPLPFPLRDRIRQWEDNLKEQFTLISLERNNGLGYALRIGLEACHYDIVARMDADDICKRGRFEKQLAFLKMHPDVDTVGGWISEFGASFYEEGRLRKVPELLKDIRKRGIYRNPINHVTTMFRKSAVLRAGNYQPGFLGLEDYHLWVRMLNNGCKFYNFQEVLVMVRVGSGMHARRGGWAYFKNEFSFQKFLLEIGFINRGHLLFNLCARIIVRLFPNKLRGTFYKVALRNR